MIKHIYNGYEDNAKIDYTSKTREGQKHRNLKE